MLNTSKFFKSDIVDTNQSITPVVVITNSQDIPIIVLAENNFDIYWGDGLTKLNIISSLKKISSVKISQDYDSKKLKINTLRIELFNFYDVNKRLSDYVDESVVNKKIYLFFKSPSTNVLNIFGVGDRDCVMTYRGEVSRIKFDKDTIKLTAEDQTQKKISNKNVPYNTIDNLPEGIKNKLSKPYEKLTGVVPMTFGSVDKAPSIVYYEKQNALCLNVIHDMHPTGGNFKTGKLLSTCNDSFVDENRDRFYLYAKDGNEYIILDHTTVTVTLQNQDISKSQIYSMSSFGTDLLLPELSAETYAIGKRTWDMKGFIERRVVSYLASDGNAASVKYAVEEFQDSLVNVHKINDFNGKRTNGSWYRQGDFITADNQLFDSGYRVLNGQEYEGTWILLNLDTAPSTKLCSLFTSATGYAGNTFVRGNWIISQHPTDAPSETPNGLSQQWSVVNFNADLIARLGDAYIWYQSEEEIATAEFVNHVGALWRGPDNAAQISPIRIGSDEAEADSGLFWGSSGNIDGDTSLQKVQGNYLGYVGGYLDDVQERTTSDDNQILIWNQPAPSSDNDTESNNYDFTTYSRLKLDNIGFLQYVLVERLNEKKIFASIIGRKCHLFTEQLDQAEYMAQQQEVEEIVDDVILEDVIVPYWFYHTGIDQQIPEDFEPIILAMSSVLGQSNPWPPGELGYTEGSAEEGGIWNYKLGQNDQVEPFMEEWHKDQTAQDSIVDDYAERVYGIDDNYFLNDYQFFLKFIFIPFHNKKTLIGDIKFPRGCGEYQQDPYAWDEYGDINGFPDWWFAEKYCSYGPPNSFYNGFADSWANEMLKFIYQTDTGYASEWTGTFRSHYYLRYQYIDEEWVSWFGSIYGNSAYYWWQDGGYYCIGHDGNKTFNDALDVDAHRQYSWSDLPHTSLEEFKQNLALYIEDLEYAFQKAIHDQFKPWVMSELDHYDYNDSEWPYVCTEIFPNISGWAMDPDSGWVSSRYWAKGITHFNSNWDTQFDALSNPIEEQALVEYTAVLGESLQEELEEEEDNLNYTTDGIIQKPSDIVMNILTNEMEFSKFFDEDIAGSGIVSPDYEKYDLDTIIDSRQVHEGWKMGFSVTRKTNGKKLIEQILAETKSYPKFTHDGKFSLINIHDKYGWDDIDRVILENDILKFKFSETKREDITTQLRVNYRYDYGNEKYEHTKLLDINTMLLEYGATAYESNGLSTIDGYKEKNLKYHSDDLTAEKFAEFYILNNCNTHNTASLTLPKNYIDLQVGDIIYIPLLNNEKIFNIDYSKVDWKNSQPVYPAWIIMETSLSIDKIDIKAVQLHYLGVDGDHGFELPEEYNQEYEVYGCTEEFNSGGWVFSNTDQLVRNYNYNPLATVDSGIRIPYFNIIYFLRLLNGDYMDWTPGNETNPESPQEGYWSSYENQTPDGWWFPASMSLQILTHYCEKNVVDFQHGGLLRTLFKYTSSGAIRVWSNEANFAADDPEFFAELIADYQTFLDVNGID